MNNNTDVETLVIDLIRRELRATSRTLDAQTPIADLAADSLALVELTLVFEETFDIDISDEEAGKIRTVRDAIVSVQTCLRAQHP